VDDRCWLVAIAVSAELVLGARGGGRSTPPAAAPSSCQADTVSDSGSGHVQNASFRVDPPSGGDHDPVPAPAGTYRLGGFIPSDVQLVHSLEHGYVVVWYRPGPGEGNMAAFADVAGRYSRDVLLVEGSSLRVRVAATAWHQRLLCGLVDPADLSRFIDRFANKGPERTPH